MIQLPKRGTRVQIAIIENGRYLLLKHHNKKSGGNVWGLPGGGVEEGESEETAALREAEEETGLKVRLLPFRIERKETRPDAIYQRYVTFLAYPLEGQARLGYDPEPEMALFFELQGIRWQDLQDDTDLDEIGLQNIRPVRELAESPALRRRAGALVLRENGSPGARFLVVSGKNGSGLWLLPQGKLEPGETPPEAARRETLEESGVNAIIERPLGFFFHERDGQFFRTDFFLAGFAGQGAIREPRQVRWVTLEEALPLGLQRESWKMISEVLGTE